MEDPRVKKKSMPVERRTVGMMIRYGYEGL
jgi:hypothetical protein